MLFCAKHERFYIEIAIIVMAKRHPLVTKQANNRHMVVRDFVCNSCLASFTSSLGYVVLLVAGICGAMIGIYNIKLEEENSFLIAVAALILIIIGLLASIAFKLDAVELLQHPHNGIGIAGFIVAISSIIKLGVN